jgi:hypothetical protein
MESKVAIPIPITIVRPVKGGLAFAKLIFDKAQGDRPIVLYAGFMPAIQSVQRGK